MNLSASIVACLFSALVVVGCGDASDKELVVSAQSFLAKKDIKSAIVQLKTALQRNPKSGVARLLLGKALLESGDAAAAEVELSKALDLQQSNDDVIPALATALLQQGKEKKLIQLYAGVTLTNPAAAADLQTSLGRAYARTGDAALAQRSIEAALKLVPTYDPARLMSARFKAANGDFDGAMTLAQSVASSAPQNAEVWLLIGDIALLGKRDLDGSMAAYQKAIAAQPGNLAAYSNVIMIRLQQNDLAAAGKELEALRKVAPSHPQTRFLDAALALLKKDYKRARELTQQLLTIAPENIRVLQLSGTIEYEAGSLRQAEAALTKAMQLAPELTLPRRLLAQTYLRLGNTARALTLVQPIVASDDADVESLATAAEANLLTGNFSAAETLFARAGRIDPKDTKVQTALALVQLSKGRVDAAFSALQSIAAKDSGTFADLALISARMRRRDHDAALKAIDALQKKQPDKPLAANLRGRVLMAMRDTRGARASFEQALAKDPSYYPAAASLAAIDIEEGHPERAKERFEELHKADRRNYKVLLAISDLRRRSGAPKEEIVQPLIEAVQLNPSDAEPRVALVQHYLGLRDYRLALTTAQEAQAALPENADVIDSLGQAQFRSGDVQQALVSFRKAATLQPNSARPHLRLAEIYSAQNDLRSAIDSAKRAVMVAPDTGEGYRTLFALTMRKKDMREALSIAKDVQKRAPSSGFGYLLEGDVEAAQRKWPEAAAAYRSALKLQSGSELAVKLDSALRSGGRTGEAAQFTTTWLKEHPNDGAFLLYSGDLALAEADYPTAEARYRAVLKLQPENVLALNNLAWLLVKVGKPGAVGLAEKANQIAPDRPHLMDTLAMSLAADNQTAKALELQKKVIGLAPEVYSFRMTLARIYLKAGEKQLAKTELERLQRLGNRFAGHNEVNALLATL